MNNSLTKKEAARLLQISERTIDYLRASGELAYVKIGRLVRFRPEDIEAFLQRKRMLLVRVESEKENP